MNLNIFLKFFIANFLVTFFLITSNGQTIVETLINCPSNSQDSLKIQFSKATINNIETFKLINICPNNGNHNSLAIDSVLIKVSVNTTDPNTEIILLLDENISTYFKIVNIELNNAIRIELAVIDEGIVYNNPNTYTDDPAPFGLEVVKVDFTIFENNQPYIQNSLQLNH